MYDPQVLVASSGMLRMVVYWRVGDAEFLKMEEEFATLRQGWKWLREERESDNADPHHREHLVYGMFDDRGSAVWVQFPSNWPGNRWNNNWVKPIPELFK